MTRGGVAIRGEHVEGASLQPTEEGKNDEPQQQSNSSTSIQMMGSGVSRTVQEPEEPVLQETRNQTSSDVEGPATLATAAARAQETVVVGSGEEEEEEDVAVLHTSSSAGSPAVSDTRHGISRILLGSVTRVKEPEEPVQQETHKETTSDEGPAATAVEAQAVAGSGDEENAALRSSTAGLTAGASGGSRADAETTAAAAALGGLAGFVGPACMGPLAVAGGPVLGLGLATTVAYGARCRPEGDALGDFSRELGKRGLQAATHAKDLSKALGRKGVEVAGSAQDRLERLDEEHAISERARQAGSKALEDVKSLGRKSAEELSGLVSGLWGPRLPPGPLRSDTPAASAA